MHLLHTLAPIFLVVLLGAILRRVNFLDPPAEQGMNRLCYWIGLPALLFLKIGQAVPTAGSALMVVKLVLGVTAAVIVLGLLVSRLLNLRAAQIGTFLQAAFRGNLAFIGLPVILFAYTGSPVQAAAQSTAAIALGPIIVVYNIAAVAVLLVSEHRFSFRAIPRVLLKMATNPLLIASALGWLWNGWATRTGILLPPFAGRALSLLGGTALPLALLCVGGALASTSLHGTKLNAVLAALLKTAVAPVVCFLLARHLGAGSMETGIAAIMSATPTAISSYVLTEQLDGDTSLAAASIVVSTLASTVSMTVVVAMI